MLPKDANIFANSQIKLEVYIFSLFVVKAALRGVIAGFMYIGEYTDP